MMVFGQKKIHNKETKKDVTLVKNKKNPTSLYFVSTSFFQQFKMNE